MTLLHDAGLGNQARIRLFAKLCRAQEQPGQGQDMPEHISVPQSVLEHSAVLKTKELNFCVFNKLAIKIIFADLVDSGWTICYTKRVKDTQHDSWR